MTDTLLKAILHKKSQGFVLAQIAIEEATKTRIDGKILSIPLAKFKKQTAKAIAKLLAAAMLFENPNPENLSWVYDDQSQTLSFYDKPSHHTDNNKVGDPIAINPETLLEHLEAFKKLILNKKHYDEAKASVGSGRGDIAHRDVTHSVVELKLGTKNNHQLIIGEVLQALMDIHGLGANLVELKPDTGAINVNALALEQIISGELGVASDAPAAILR